MGLVSRVCKDCSLEKPLSELVKVKGCKFGRRELCKKCAVIRQQKRYDPDKKPQYDKDRREVKGDTLRAYDKERAKLPHRRAAKNEHTRKRKATLKGQTPDNYDREGVLAMYKFAQKLTNLTGVEMHVDHIEPLSKGGLHDLPNLQLLAAPLNLAKGSGEKYQSPHWQLPWSEYK